LHPLPLLAQVFFCAGCCLGRRRWIYYKLEKQASTNADNDCFFHLTYLEVASLSFAPSFSKAETSSPEHQTVLNSPHLCCLMTKDGKLFDTACFRTLVVAPAEWSVPQCGICLIPLLHDGTTTLKLGQILQLGALVFQILVGEGGHESESPALAGSAAGHDEVVDIADCVACVET